MHLRNIRGLVIAAAVLLTTPVLAQPTDVAAINANCKDANLFTAEIEAGGLRFCEEISIDGMDETYIRHFQRM